MWSGQQQHLLLAGGKLVQDAGDSSGTGKAGLVGFCSQNLIFRGRRSGFEQLVPIILP